MTARQRLHLLAALVTVLAITLDLTERAPAQPFYPPPPPGYEPRLADAERRPVDVSWEDWLIYTPPSTSLVPIPTTTEPPPPPAICHAEHSNAIAVSEAIRHHFASGDWSTACRVAWCESNFNPKADNPSSSAYGLFQILTGTWGDEAAEFGYDLGTIWGSTAMARYIRNVQGWNAWSCY